MANMQFYLRILKLCERIKKAGNETDIKHAEKIKKTVMDKLRSDNREAIEKKDNDI